MQPDDIERPESSSDGSVEKYDTQGQPIFAPIEALIGTDLGHYHVVSEIGRGSMGVVFEGFHRLTKQQIAIKVLPPNISGSDKVIRRFLREAESVAKLSHPNIVKIFDIGHKDSLYYYAMERISGKSLEDLLKKERLLSYKRIARLMIQACDAVHFAHEQHIIHRDIKPGNIIVTEDDKVVITDFGLARQEKAATLTESGALVGTPIYMSPEQVLAKRGGVDTRTDIYSLGVTLYQLAAGRPPFRAESTQKILNLILEEDPPPPRRLGQNVPRALRIISMKAMEKDPGARFQSAGEMADELRRYLRGASIKSKPTSLIFRAARKIKKHKVISGLAALSVILALAFIINAVTTSRTIQDSRDQRNESVLTERARNETYYKNVEAAKDFLALPPGSRTNIQTVHQLITEAVALFPKRPEAHLYLGKIYYDQGDYGRALPEFQVACELGPEYCEAFLERALFLLNHGIENKIPEAINLGFADLNKAMNLEPENPLIIYHMARTLYNGSNAADLKFEERRQMLIMAYSYADKARNLEDTPDTECLMAQIYLELAHDVTSRLERNTNLRSALACLNRALDLDPSHAIATQLAGEVEKMLSQPEEDLRQVGTWEFIQETGLAASIEHADQIYKMVLNGVEKTWSETETTEVIEKVMGILMGPDSAVVSLATQQLEAVAESELDLDYPGLLDRASECMDNENYGAAIRCFEKARMLNPTKAHELNYKIAEAYYKLRKLGPALQHARLAYLYDPGRLPYVALLGMLLQESGDMEGFSQLYREAERNGNLSLLDWELPELESDEGSEPASSPGRAPEIRLR